MIVLIGESGVGKTSAETELVDRGYIKSVSITTRIPREGEIEGVSYYFRTVEEVLRLKAEGKLGEHIEYLGNHYALEKDQIKEGRVVVVEPTGLMQLRENDDLDILVIYLSASEDVRRSRMINRGDSPLKVEERIENDRRTFKNVRELSDYVINTEDLTLSEVVDEIIRIEKESKNK